MSGYKNKNLFKPYQLIIIMQELWVSSVQYVNQSCRWFPFKMVKMDFLEKALILCTVTLLYIYGICLTLQSNTKANSGLYKFDCKS